MQVRRGAAVLAQAFWLLLRHCVLFAGAVSVVAVPETLLLFSPGFRESSIPGQILISLAAVIVAGVGTRVASDTFLDHETGALAVYTAIGLDGASALIFSMLAVAIAVGAGFILVIPGLYLLVRLLFVPAAAVVEKGSIGDVLVRTWDLTGDAWWLTFGVFLVSSLPVALVTVLARLYLRSDVSLIVQYLIVPVVLWPFTLASTTLLYYELRACRGDVVARPLDVA